MRTTPTFRKWMELQDEQSLFFHSKPYKKLADDNINEKRLFRRIIGNILKNYEHRQVKVECRFGSDFNAILEAQTLSTTHGSEEEEEVTTNVDFATDVDGANCWRKRGL